MKIPSMKNNSTRALTFLKYPGSIVIQDLVAWGLFYSGNNRDLQCFYCGHIFNDWKENDSAKFRHLQELPSCEYFQQMKRRDESGNFPDRATNIFNGPSPFSHLNGAGPGINGQVGGQSSSPSDSIFRSDLQQGASNNLPQQTPPRHMFVGDEVERERHIDLRTREGRLSTFTDWPKSDIISPEELATAGFKYLHSDDRVQCVFCRGILKNWQLGDRALDEHRKFFNACPYLESLGDGIVQRSGLTASENAAKPKPKVTPSSLKAIGIIPTAENALENMDTSSLGVVTARAKYPLYSVVERRIESFNSDEWKQQALPQTPKDFATGGLFYTGPKDRVRCFFCGGGMEEWSIHDVPIDEHKRWYPECPFLEQLENESIRQLTNQLESSMGGAVGGASAAALPRTPTKPEDTPEGKYLIEMGYSAKDINRSYKKLQQQGKTDIKASDLLDEIFKEEDGLLGEVGDSETTNANLDTMKKTQEYISESDHHEEKEDIPTKAQPVNTEGEYTTTTGSDVTAVNSAHDAAYEAELRENEKLRQMFYCWHCKDKISNVLFLPCSHMIYCQDCYQGNAGNLICAKCNSHVRGIVKTYTS